MARLDFFVSLATTSGSSRVRRKSASRMVHAARQGKVLGVLESWCYLRWLR